MKNQNFVFTFLFFLVFTLLVVSPNSSASNMNTRNTNSIVMSMILPSFNECPWGQVVYGINRDGSLRCISVNSSSFNFSNVNVNNSNYLSGHTWDEFVPYIGASKNLNTNYNITTTGSCTCNNLNVSGNATLNTYYGSMYNFSDVGWNIGIVTSGIYYNLTVSTIGELNGFKIIQEGTNGTKLQAQISGVYSVDGVLSAEFTGGEYGIGIVTNGANPEVLGRCYTRTNNNAEAALPITCLKRLNAGDNVTMVVDDESTPTKDIKVHTINIRLIRIGN